VRIRISSPPYHSGSGGIRVLHRLGYLATLLGHRVDMTTPVLNPDWGAYHAPFEGEPDLSVIPEIWPASEPGNVIRWVLYFPGVLAGPTLYPDHELVVSFCEQYNLAALQASPSGRIEQFFLATCELPCRDDPEERLHDGCYWQGKGPRINPPGDAMLREITRGWPTPRRELVRLFRQCRALYSCDAHTAINQEAQLCGCDVFVWDGGWEPWHDPFAEMFLPTEEKQLEQVEEFLTKCGSHFGVLP
jgi:hypothetical protein